MSTQPTDAELKAMWQLHAADIGGIFYYARAVLAKWGQPAQAAEPVAVVVPCYTPSGKRVALYSAKQDLPIGTKLYAAHQPSPTAQAADSVQEDAARLDFIERYPEMSLRHRKGRWAFLGFTNYEYDLHQSLRDAIDASMAASKQGANHD